MALLYSQRMNSTNLLNRSFVARTAATLGIMVASALFYQNCAPQKFSVNQASTSGITPAGTTCLPSVSVRPQLTFVPSSFNADQAFTVTIANQSLYTLISIDFGDGSQSVNVNPTSLSPITHTYTRSGNFVITTSGSEPVCGNSFSGTQFIGVGACIPNAATLQTSTNPQLPVAPAPIAPFQLSASIANGSDFTTGQTGWVLSGTTSARYSGSDVNISLSPGGYVLQAQAVDTCGTTRTGPPENICVAAAGAPVVTVAPASFTAGIANTFTITKPGDYGALKIDFGDGTVAAIPASGLVTHTYANAGSKNFTVSGTDTCGGARTLTTPVTISAPTCSPTQADGCSGNQYCTGRTTCNPTGSCATSCGQCGYAGNPVVQDPTCDGLKSCVKGGFSCSPTSTCTSTCGQCGFTGDPVNPVTTCADNKVCVTGGTTCALTSICTTVPGQCGEINPGQPTTTTTLFVPTTTTLFVPPTTTTLYVAPTTTTLYVAPTTTTLYVAPTTTTLYVAPTTTTLYVAPPTTTLYVAPTTTTLAPSCLKPGQSDPRYSFTSGTYNYQNLCGAAPGAQGPFGISPDVYCCSGLANYSCSTVQVTNFPTWNAVVTVICQ